MNNKLNCCPLYRYFIFAIGLVCILLFLLSSQSIAAEDAELIRIGVEIPTEFSGDEYYIENVVWGKPIKLSELE